MNMTKAAKRAGVPRTTVDAIIRRLLKQGLVSREKVRGHYEYFVNTGEVANTLDWMEKRFRKDANLDGAVSVSESQKYEEEKEYDEKKVILEEGSYSFADIAAKHRGDRVRLLFSRGQESDEEWVLRFAKYATIAIQHNLKLEVLLDAAVADALIGKGSVPMPPVSDMIRLNIVPALYGIAVEDVFMFRDSMLLVSTHKESRQRVSERSLVDLSKHLLDIACETGWSVDLTAWMNSPAH